MELFLQVNGNVCFTEYNGEYYIFTGGLGGEPDVYYRPTLYTIANPALNISKSLVIDEECIIIPNDTLYIGLLPLFSRYSTLLSTTELSLEMAIINARMVALISSDNDRTTESAKLYLKDIRDGKMGVIDSNPFFEGIKTQPIASISAKTLTDLIETEQYIKASWYNEIGLNSNYNMKRETLNAEETQLNNDALLPLIDDMYNTRKTAIEKINKMYGLNISIEYNSAWDDKQIETNQNSTRMENEGGENNESQEND